MVKSGGCFGFGVKALHQRRRGQLPGQNHLERHRTIETHRKESSALAETLTGSVTRVSTPPLSFCAFCAFLWPSTSVLRFTREARQTDNPVPHRPDPDRPPSAQSRREPVQDFQSLIGFPRGALPGRQHHTPMGRGELGARAWRIAQRLVGGRSHARVRRVRYGRGAF